MLYIKFISPEPRSDSRFDHLRFEWFLRVFLSTISRSGTRKGRSGCVREVEPYSDRKIECAYRKLALNLRYLS
jgi:uncharacterized protein YmfQ (DUF2313 family)